jgi:ketosteroid isomerase-like protein
MQRNIIYLFVSIATFLTGTIITAPWRTAEHAAPQPASYTAAEQELLSIERRYLDAHVERDAAALDSILADDFIIANSRGRVSDKASRLALVEDSDFTFVNIETFDVDAHVNGDEGVVTGSATVTGRYQDREFQSPPYRFIRRYEKRQGRWQIVSVQFAPRR